MKVGIRNLVSSLWRVGVVLSVMLGVFVVSGEQTSASISERAASAQVDSAQAIDIAWNVKDWLDGNKINWGSHIYARFMMTNPCNKYTKFEVLRDGSATGYNWWCAGGNEVRAGISGSFVLNTGIECLNDKNYQDSILIGKRRVWFYNSKKAFQCVNNRIGAGHWTIRGTRP